VILSELTASVESLPGVGPQTARQFASLNIFTVADLLSTFPRNYEDRTKKIPLADFALFPKVHSIFKVTAHAWFGYGKMRTLKIAVDDGTARGFLVAFNRNFLENVLTVGSIICVTGKFEEKFGELQSSSFDAVRISYDGNLDDYKNFSLPDSGVIPVYPLTEGLSRKNYAKSVAVALEKFASSVDSEIPPDVMKKRSLLEKKDALKKIHRPENLAQVAEAKRTLIFEELYLFEYKLAERTFLHRGNLPQIDENEFLHDEISSAKKIPSDDEKKIREEFEKSLSPRQKILKENLPFDLTAHQMKAIFDMNCDIDRSQTECNALLNSAEKKSRPPFSMQRLLQGDVGSGKTLVSFFVCLRTVDYGGQCAVLAPTEILARQHAENAIRLLEKTDVNVAFLTGNLKSSGRENLVNALRDGKIDIVIGTHALFSRNTVYKNLQLAVIDEQHRFGVTQRESILAKGRISVGGVSHGCDLLMMSATPIPQTLALTAFGDLDSSVIKTMPKGRLPVKTFLTRTGNEKNVYDAVKKELRSGHQAYFVYPRIGDGENDDESLKGAEKMFGFLSKKIYAEFSCALIHGKIDEKEQSEILKKFSRGEIQVLVATTVVEVGVDVPNATCIAVECADRFGLAELHQLRGRVGRGNFQSYCFLVYGKNISETGIARLKALRQSNDGFFIAEEDLKLRGPGEILGTSQSGYLALNIADLSRDREILSMARFDAFENFKQRNL
jgi:ATP-dependent DNA helicase RecG